MLSRRAIDAVHELQHHEFRIHERQRNGHPQTIRLRHGKVPQQIRNVWHRSQCSEKYSKGRHSLTQTRSTKWSGLIWNYLTLHFHGILSKYGPVLFSSSDKTIHRGWLNCLDRYFQKISPIYHDIVLYLWRAKPIQWLHIFYLMAGVYCGNFINYQHYVTFILSFLIPNRNLHKLFCAMFGNRNFKSPHNFWRIQYMIW